VRLVSLLVSLLVGCETPVEPPAPADLVAFNPPRRFAAWWQLVESCAGRTGDFNAVRWYIAPDAHELRVGGEDFQGYWWSRGNRIALAEHWRFDGQLVRHEMLHALVGSGHAPVYFRDRCGGIVSCDGDCATEAGDPYSAPKDAPVVAPSDLNVALTLSPAEPSASLDSAWATVVITATNPHPYPVWVQLEPIGPEHPASATFGFQERHPDYDYRPAGSSYTYVWSHRVAFRASETRRYSFDQMQFAGMRMRGFFNSQSASEVVVRVRP
jgi:hypothetical protein